MPTLVFGFLMFWAPQLVNDAYFHKWFLLLMVFLTTYVIPLLSILMMKLTGNIASFHMETKEERVFPFSMISLFYMVVTYFFYLKFQIDPVFILAMASITVCVILLTSLTFFWKISAHMIGISGFMAIVAAVSIKYPTYFQLEILLGSIVLVGLIGSARLNLNAHRPFEVYLGFAIGFAICFGSFFFMA
ncbi:PA-phosphatase [Shivajiella indica]|uniref:PA-phosphatase n=1 Tax=Shivajiella indica TaxID=872115 RepID=A0ABW5BEU6_9BACT